MRVLVVSASFPPICTGGSDYAFRLCQKLAETHAPVHVVSNVGARADEPGMGVHAIMSTWAWSELPRLLRTVDRIQPDIVNLQFVGHRHAHPMVSLLPSFLKRRHPNLAFVTTMEDPFGLSLRRWSPVTWASRELAGWALRRRELTYRYGSLLRDSDRVIVLSDTHRQELRQRSGADDSRWVVMPVPALMEVLPDPGGSLRAKTRQRLGVRDGELLLAYHGLLIPGKGLEALLAALARAPDHRLLLVGGTPAEYLARIGRPAYADELRRLAAELGVADRLLWSGYYESGSKEPSRLLRAADVAVVPLEIGADLHNSSIATVVAHGLPLITTKKEGVSDFRDGDNVLFSAARPDALAAAIERVASDQMLRARLANGAVALAAARFPGWSRIVEQTLDIFDGARAEAA